MTTILILWWLIVAVLTFSFMTISWQSSTRVVKSIIILVALGGAFIVPIILIKVTPFAQWFLHIIGA